MRPLASTVALGAALLLASSPAAAYCRLTTCDPVATSCATNANGCVRDGVPLRWRSLPIVYRFSAAGSAKLTDESGTRAAIRRAFDAWSNVQCTKGRTSLRFTEGADVAGAVPDDFHDLTTNGVYFRDEEWPHQNADESIALTTQRYGVSSGYIDWVVLEINTANNAFRVTDEEQGVDLQAAVTHEVGHYIGLAHSPDPDSIMVARYCQADDASGTSSRCSGGVDRSRALAADDIAAVCALYPPSSSTSSTTPAATGGCAAAPSPASTGLPVLAGLALAVASLRRRARRR